MTTVTGTSEDDILELTESRGAHSIRGGDGNDTAVVDLRGVAGNLNTISSGGVVYNDLPSNDPLYFSLVFNSIENINIKTGDGQDYLYLFAGDDVVSSGGGNDSINTRTGKASVNGGAGNDLWIADLNTTTADSFLDLSLTTAQAFHGGFIRNIEHVELTLGSGDDTVLTLTGAAGRGLNDRIIGGLGDDTARLGGGSDSFNGGGGDDLAIIELGDQTAALDTFNSGGVITNNLSGLDLVNIFLSGVERVNITSGAGDDHLYLFGSDDVVSSGGGADSINTRTGRASVNGGGGNDLWIADLGTTTANSFLDLSKKSAQNFHGGVIQSVEHVELILGSGDDTVLTLTGAVGRGLNDRITGGDGDDTARLGGGVDNFSGGDGDDLAIIDLTGALGNFTTINSGGVISNNLTGLDLVTVALGGVEGVNITGSASNDQFLLFDGNDVVSAGAGDDIFNTRKGAAVIDGGDGSDLWIADFSDSTRTGTLDLAATGVQRFMGGSVTKIEAVNLTMGSGNDTILTLTGTAGRGMNDTVNGGEGNDVVKVGGGIDNVSGGGGTDDLLIIDLTGTAGNFTTTGSGGSISNGLTGLDQVQISQSGFEGFHITGANGNDGFFTANGADIVDGGAGDDTLTANGGNDMLSGGKGNDTLEGGAGLDRLIGGAGADILTGGLDADTFVFLAVSDSTTAAPDRITDLTNADIIDLSAIDAVKAQAGDQAFVLVDAFTRTAGEIQLIYDAASSTTRLSGDVNGDGKADFLILLSGQHMDFTNFVF